MKLRVKGNRKCFGALQIWIWVLYMSLSTTGTQVHVMDRCYLVVLFCSPHSHPPFLGVKVQWTASLCEFGLYWAYFPAPGGGRDSDSAKQGICDAIPEMCRKFRERGMAGLLRTGKQRGCESSAAGSHQPPQQGRLCVKIADREEKHSKDVERGRLHPLGSGITEASSAPQLYMNY